MEAADRGRVERRFPDAIRRRMSQLDLLSKKKGVSTLC